MRKKRSNPYYQVSRRKFSKRNSGRRYSRKRRRNGRRRGLMISLLLLVALGIWIAKRYRAWFISPAEVAYTVPHTIDRLTLTPGEDFLTQRTVSWRCDTLPQDSWLDYRSPDGADADTLLISLPAEGKEVVTRAGRNYYYHAKINGLKPGRTYTYRVKTGELTSPWYRFSIPDSSAATDFIYIGDVQDPGNGGTQALLQRLRTLHPNPDFLALGGDQIEGPTDFYWEVWHRVIGDWTASTPVIAATGNHEYIKGLKRQLDPRWVPQYNYPANGPKGFERRSYYIDFPHMRLIVMDTNDIQWPASVFNHRTWLKNALETTVQPWKVVMFHHGVYSVRQGRMNPIIRYGFRSILEEGGADLVLQGHDHAYSRITTKTESGTKTTPVYIISSASPKHYRNGFSEQHDRIGSGLYLYQTIHVTPGEIRYRSTTFDNRPYDDLHLKKQGGRTTVKDNAEDWKEIFAFDNFADSKKGRKKRADYRQAAQERAAGHR